MSVEEVPFIFDCQGESLIGILHQPVNAASIGILIVVGGPQYRVGSHRQFLLLARSLSANDIPVLRFDYRAMGDSGGNDGDGGGNGDGGGGHGGDGDGHGGGGDGSGSSGSGGLGDGTGRDQGHDNGIHVPGSGDGPT